VFIPFTIPAIAVEDAALLLFGCVTRSTVLATTVSLILPFERLLHLCCHYAWRAFTSFCVTMTSVLRSHYLPDGLSVRLHYRIEHRTALARCFHCSSPLRIYRLHRNAVALRYPPFDTGGTRRFGRTFAYIHYALLHARARVVRRRCP